MSTFARIKTEHAERMSKIALTHGIEHSILAMPEAFDEWTTFVFTTPRSRLAFERLCAEAEVTIDGAQVIDRMLDAVIGRDASPKQVIEAFVTHKMTKGIANAMGRIAAKNVKYTCADCNFTVPRYTGRYPSACPQCGGSLSAPKESVDERQKAAAAGDFPDEGKHRKGAFKVGANFSKMAKEIYGGRLEDVLFTQQRALINSIPREELPAIWGADNIPDAQDVIARQPKHAFQLFLLNAHKANAKLGTVLRRVPQNAPILFYAIMVRVSGRDMADIILKKYFSTDQEYAPKKVERDLGTFSQWLKTVTRLLNAKGRGTAAKVYKKFLKTQWEDGVLPQDAAEELIGKEE